MRNFLMNAAMSVALAATAFTFTPASAQDIQLEIGRDGPKVRVLQDCNPRYEDCRGDRYGRDDNNNSWRGDRRDNDRRTARACTDDRALDKAERMGIRRARIESSGRRMIEVRGRARDGDRVTIAFGRAANCPVLTRG